MDRIGQFETKRFSKHRRDIALYLSEGKRKHSAHAVLEFDITESRRCIRAHRERTGERLSFTGWLITCLARAIEDHKEFNTYRQGRRKLVIFDDVDVGVTVERVVNGRHITMAHIIRKANEKNVGEISAEIRQLQEESVSADTQIIGTLSRFERFVLASPGWFKKLLLVILRRNAFMKKKHLGTVGLTAIGMLGTYPGWAIPLGGTTNVVVAVGGITTRPSMVEKEIQMREFLHVTITFDHDLVDGGPLVRFTTQLSELLEGAYDLPPLDVDS